MARKQLIATGRRFALALRRQRKVLLLFLLTVLVPSGVLSVLGLRALEADQFRIERLIRHEQEEAMRGVRRRLSSQLESTAKALEAITADLNETDDWVPLRRKILSHDRARQSSGNVIVLSSSGSVLFAREGFLRLTADREATAVPSQNELRDAEHFEFALRDPRSAVPHFARLAQTKAPEIRLAALNALGRAYTRTGQYARALSAYKEVLREWPEVLSSETAPFPLMAGLQILFCLEAVGQPSAAMPELLFVYEAMVARRWIVAPDTIAFYSSEYERAIGGMCGHDPTEDGCSAFARLRARMPARLDEIRRLDALAEELALRLRSGSDSAAMRAPFWLRGSEAMVVTAPFPPNTDAKARTGSLLTATLGRQTLLERLSAPDHGSLSVRVVDAVGKIISGDPTLEPGEIVLREKLGDGLPDWTVTLFPETSEYEHFAARTRNLYVALTGLLIAVLVLGAFLIVRTVHHDMELIRLKSDFVSLVSHEFKTPIASMRALMDRLQAGHVSDPERKQRYYDIISGELQRVTRLVNNVLDFSRMEEGRKDYFREETDLPQLVRDLLSTFEAGASAKGFRIETDIRLDLPKVRVDRDAISQALLNLLDNAVKYSPTEKWIRVAVERNSHTVRISVADRGSGIPPDEVAAIFSKFYRGRGTRSQPVPGLGLGLSLVEHVMAGHGGGVTVESLPGSGTVFRLSIPLPETLTANR